MSTKTPTAEQTESDIPSLNSRHVHITLQGKGGIGKSLVARLLAEYLDAPLYDLDWTNRTNSRYQNSDSFNVRFHDLRIDASPDGNQEIDSLKIDMLVEDLLDKTAPYPHRVLDFGSPQYDPVIDHFQVSDAIQTLYSEAKTVLWFHLIICGGGMQLACAENILRIVTRWSRTPAQFVIWENEFVGLIRNERTDERDSKSPGFKSTELYDTIRTRIHPVQVIMPARSGAYKRDVESMEQNSQGFKDFVTRKDIPMLQRSRIKKIWQEYADQLDLVFAPKRMENIVTKRGVMVPTETTASLSEARTGSSTEQLRALEREAREDSPQKDQTAKSGDTDKEQGAKSDEKDKTTKTEGKPNPLATVEIPEPESKRDDYDPDDGKEDDPDNFREYTKE